MQNSFKIISGDFRGRKFSFPAVEGLRPTSGKIRATLLIGYNSILLTKLSLIHLQEVAHSALKQYQEALKKFM